MNLELLDRLCQAPGIASRESAVRSVVDDELRPIMDELTVDTLGNLIATRHGTGPRIMIAAHMDEIGFVVKHVDDNGFIRIQSVGGFDPRVLVAQRVLVHRRSGDALPGVLQPGTKPVHLMQPGDSKELKLDDLMQPGDSKELKLDDLFVDTGETAYDVRDSVFVGDMVTLDRSTARMGNRMVSKALDDRLGLYVMIEAVRATSAGDAEIVAVATTQEEVGLRGAETAAYAIEPDIAIALDVTLAGDIPGMPKESAVTKLGDGAGIKVFDSSQLSHPAIVDSLRAIAEREDIPHQMEVLPRGGNDGGVILRSRSGVYTGTISIPCRYVHTVNEMADIGDIEACVSLLARFVEQIQLDNLSHE